MMPMPSLPAPAADGGEQFAAMPAPELLEDDEPDDEEEEAAPRLTRVRRPRKRKKRLSLTTSPGLLSGVDRSSLHSGPRTERPALAKSGSSSREPATRSNGGARIESAKPVVQMRTVSLDSPFAESIPVPIDRVPVAKPARVETLPPSAAANTRPPSATNHSPPSAAASPPQPARMLRAVAPPPKPETEHSAAVHEFTRPSWQEPRQRSVFEQDTPTASSPDIDALLAQAAEESRVDWTSASTFPPIHSRKPLVWAVCSVLLVLGLLAMWMARPSKSPYVAPEPPSKPVAERAPEAPAAQPAIEKARQPEPAAEPQLMAAEPTLAPNPEPPAQAETNLIAGAPAPPSAAETASDAKDMLSRAQKLEAQGKPKQALSLYEAAAEQMPTDTNVLSRLAFGYLNRGRSNDAASFAARAVERESSNAEGWIVLGAARDQLGDHRGARDAYKKCAELGKGSYVTECRNMLR
jgi:hypothetical protein